MSAAGVQGKQWKMLVDMQLDAGDKQAAVELFGRCLTNCVTLDLWKGYMRYIHMVRASYCRRVCLQRCPPVRRSFQDAFVGTD